MNEQSSIRRKHNNSMSITLLYIDVFGYNVMDKYVEVVSEWYENLHTPFVNFIKGQFSDLSYDDIEDIYQNTFITVYENIKSGKVREDTTWRSYILGIGKLKALNQVQRSHKQVDIYSPGSNLIRRCAEEVSEDELPVYKDETALKILDEQVKYLPEPCHTILLMFYHEKKSLDEISKTINFKNSQTAKVRKSQCMRKLKERVKQAFLLAGINKY